MSNPTYTAPHIGILYSGQTSLIPRYAAVAVSNSGDNTIVAAVPGKRILVLQYNVMANGTVNAKWKDGASADLTGLGYYVANTGKVVPFSPIGWMVTTAGNALILNLTAAIAVGGELGFALID
jgi:hypothetical protein